MSESEHDASFATTLAKGIAILEAYTPKKNVLSNAQISEITGINRSTVARLTYTLEKLGYLSQSDFKYKVTWKALTLSNSILTNLRILQISRPFMQQFSRDIGATLSLGTIDTLNFVYLETSRTDDNILSTPDVGTVGPLLPATIGHALSSLLTNAELATLQAQVQESSPDLWEKYSESFIKGVRDCRERGFSVAWGRWIPGTNTAAAPIIRDENLDCFALSCRLPAYRLRPTQIEDEIGPRLKSLADAIRTQLRPD